MQQADITMIGGITADIEVLPHGQLVMEDANLSKISISFGGIGLNIVENLARLGVSAAFISTTGNDFAGRSAADHLQNLGVNVDNVYFMEGENTATYVSVFNLLGDLELSLYNRNVIDRISPSLIDGAMATIKASKIVGLDASLPIETLKYITETLEGIPLFLDPASILGAEQAKEIIGKVHTVKANRVEAEVLCGKGILSEDEIMAAGNWFTEQGVQRVFITMGAGGAYYKEGTQEGILRPTNGSVVRTPGAGDTFAAAVMDGFVRGMYIKETAEYAMAASALALESRALVNPRMSAAAVQAILDECTQSSR